MLDEKEMNDNEEKYSHITKWRGFKVMQKKLILMAGKYVFNR